jgi:NAD(P)-dependent dehydrogenase (short-subunit alcohol dehydrogenase family)
MARLTNAPSRLDALVNNAAVGEFPEGTSTAEKFEQCFRTNATGPQLMIDAFYPLLKKSITTPRIINVSSGAGSVGIIGNMKPEDWPVPGGESVYKPLQI